MNKWLIVTVCQPVYAERLEVRGYIYIYIFCVDVSLDVFDTH